MYVVYHVLQATPFVYTNTLYKLCKTTVDDEDRNFTQEEAEDLKYLSRLHNKNNYLQPKTLTVTYR